MKNAETEFMRMGGFHASEECPLDERVWQGLEYLESVAGPGAVAEMVDHFGVDMPDRIQRMRSLLQSGDLEQLSRLAHDLKSNSATLGIPAISALGASIEQSVEGGSVEDVTFLLDEIERLFPLTFLALERRRSSFTSRGL